MILATVIVVLVVANMVTSAWLERLRAKQTQFLINTALSNNTYEFAVRQSASQETKPAADTDDTFDDLPDGLFG